MSFLFMILFILFFILATYPIIFCVLTYAILNSVLSMEASFIISVSIAFILSRSYSRVIYTYTWIMDYGLLWGNFVILINKFAQYIDILIQGIIFFVVLFINLSPYIPMLNTLSSFVVLINSSFVIYLAYLRLEKVFIEFQKDVFNRAISENRQLKDDTYIIKSHTVDFDVRAYCEKCKKYPIMNKVKVSVGDYYMNTINLYEIECKQCGYKLYFLNKFEAKRYWKFECEYSHPTDMFG